LEETVKGHLKGQRQGICSTKQKALEKIIANETVRIKIEGKDSPFHLITITKTHKAFIRTEDLTKSIRTNQMEAFLFSSQQGNRYIMVAIPLESKEDVIRVYKKIINRMSLAGLVLKKHTLDNKALAAFKQCIQEQHCYTNWSPWGTTNATRQSAQF
jgi:hypothetical protein